MAAKRTVLGAIREAPFLTRLWHKIGCSRRAPRALSCPARAHRNRLGASEATSVILFSNFSRLSPRVAERPTRTRPNSVPRGDRILGLSPESARARPTGNHRWRPAFAHASRTRVFSVKTFRHSLGGGFRVGDNPGIIGKGYAICVVYLRRSLHRDHPEFGLSQLRISKSIPASDMIQKGRAGGDQCETSAAADQQMNGWVTDTVRRKDHSVRPDREQGAREHEAEEHNLPLVRQRRA
jgi:hypothetical protein